MRATWRALAAWLYEPRPKQSTSFHSTWDATLALLEREVERIDGDDVVIGVVCDPSQISFSGALKAGARAAIRHPGVEISFETAERGRLTFHTDAFNSLAWNLRAVALGLEALRTVDRYGITSSGEQYTGFAQLAAGGPDAERGRVLVERAGSLTEALKRHHPDHGGEARDFVDVQAFKKAHAAATR